MKKKHQWKENLQRLLEVPRDLALKESVFTVTGNSRIRIENYRCILRYETQELVILTFSGKLIIHGNHFGSCATHRKKCRFREVYQK